MRNRSKSASKQPSHTAFLPLKLNWWHGLFFVLGLSVALALHFLVPATGHSSLVAKRSATIPRVVAEGPWGQVEYTNMRLERPDESFPEVLPTPEPIQWVFENMKAAEIEGLIAAAELTAEQKTVLLDRTRWKAAGSGWVISPPLELVRDMSMPGRRAIYAVLSQSGENTYIQNPCRLNPETLELWLAESGLSTEKQGLFRQLVIQEGEQAYFCDGLLMEWLCTPQERKSLAQAVAQTPTLFMKLRITPDTDVAALMKYWGQSGRGKGMEPMLKSLTRIPEGAVLSVSYFFPTFARMRLYTYPDIRHDPMAERKDCFWTSMNFWNESPDYTLFDRDKLLAKLKSEYKEVSGDYRFGDVIALVGSDKMVVHMCVYIADDVVFTKNGGASFAPWVLMKRADMLKEYPSEKPLRMRVYRKNVNEPAPASA